MLAGGGHRRRMTWYLWPSPGGEYTITGRRTQRDPADADSLYTLQPIIPQPSSSGPDHIITPYTVLGAAHPLPPERTKAKAPKPQYQSSSSPPAKPSDVCLVTPSPDPLARPSVLDVFPTPSSSSSPYHALLPQYLVWPKRSPYHRLIARSVPLRILLAHLHPDPSGP